MPEPWWYLKRRRNPNGVLGRPRSPVPLAKRRKLARQKYREELARRGLRTIRLLLPDVIATRLHDLARQRGVSAAQLIADLLPPNE